MTNLLARILLAIMLLPLAVMVYLVVLFAAMGIGNRSRHEGIAFLAATLVTATFVAIYWVRLWRDSVNWTSGRVSRTVFSGAMCIGAGCFAAVVLNAVSNINELSFGVFIAGLVSLVSWLPITVVIWKETPSERAERLSQAAIDVLFCPRCGYNMTGLREARCPECGAQFTLNQLYATQQKHEIGDAVTPREEHVSRCSDNNSLGTL